MQETSMQYRRIATEEAWAIPEQFDAWRELIKKSTDYDPDLFLARVQTDGGLLSTRLLDADDERLRIMDEAGIDVHLLALTSTGVQALETELAVSIAALGNDRLAELIARHPSRYAGLATVAPQDPRRAAREIERAIRTLKLNGVMINSHTDGEYLDEPRFWPILETAAGLNVPIYIHPRSPSPAMATPYRKYHIEQAMWDYSIESGMDAGRIRLGSGMVMKPDGHDVWC